jgi:hypothetical protein
MSPSGHFRRIQRGVSTGCGPLCPESAEAWPGTGEHCVWPDACDSNSQTGARIMHYELADYEWAAIRPMLPNKPRGVLRGERPACPQRHFLGPSIWSRIIDALAVAHDAAVQMIDTFIVRVHQHGNLAPSKYNPRLTTSGAKRPMFNREPFELPKASYGLKGRARRYRCVLSAGHPATHRQPVRASRLRRTPLTPSSGDTTYPVPSIRCSGARYERAAKHRSRRRAF